MYGSPLTRKLARGVVSLCGGAVLLSVMVSPGYGQGTRPLSVDDLLALEQLVEVVPSPDGEWLALVIVRARTAAEIYRNFPSNHDVDHADVWLLPRRGGAPSNITKGVADGSGYWNPVWSPDSKRLAMLSTKGGDNVRPYVWRAGARTAHRLSQRGVDLAAWGENGWPRVAMIWSDTATVLFPALPDGAPPSFDGMSRVRSYHRAIQYWAQAERGQQPTVSVLESGHEVPEADRSQGELLAVDVRSGRTRAVAEGSVRRILVSPTGRHVALLAEIGRIPLDASRTMTYQERPYNLLRTRLTILDLQTGKAVVAAGVIDPMLTAAALPHSWSPDGSSLAVIAKHAKDDQTADALVLVDAVSGAVTAVTDRRLVVSSAAWSPAGELLGFAQPRSPAALRLTGARSRFDWWVIDPDAHCPTRNLTADLETVPPALIRAGDDDAMIGLASGEIWSIDLRGQSVVSLTDELPVAVESMVRPEVADGNRFGLARRAPIVHGEDGRFYRIERSGRVPRTREVHRPSARATIAAYWPDQHAPIWMADERTGTYLWTGDGIGEAFEPRLALNERLGRVADARRVLVDYLDADGDSLKALLILPVNYEPERRFPVVVYVYAGLVLSDSVFGGIFEKQNPGSLNLHLLAGRGYGVLIPSIPLDPPGSSSDPLLDLPKGVMSAVNRVVELGYVDPNRLAVMGHSYGGYSTLGLVTYTNRFRAAIALAGLSDLVSLYGSFRSGRRYDDFAHEDLFWVGLSESGQIRMGNAPWRDLWRYLRNSPVHYVERVQTPVMIVQGDIDYVPMQQGEAFFAALYRMGKKASFIRYWGEGHVIESPANVRDMWNRIFGWLDEHLAGPDPVSAERAVPGLGTGRRGRPEPAPR